uniref:Uncharacterized protein n=1 Tax=Timema tahoe TaxID=61484 RepID=A0A7R9IUC3_9NEOP|nr:unnamed protein product [Timema tahoe]
MKVLFQHSVKTWIH